MGMFGVLRASSMPYLSRITSPPDFSLEKALRVKFSPRIRGALLPLADWKEHRGSSLIGAVGD